MITNSQYNNTPQLNESLSDDKFKYQTKILRCLFELNLDIDKRINVLLFDDIVTKVMELMNWSN